MAKKNTKLSVVQTLDQNMKKTADLTKTLLNQAKNHADRELELDRLHDQERDRWTELENQWRISPQSARQRVLALRDELERYRLQLEGSAFDVANGDMSTPPSLDGGDRKYTLYLATDLNPIVDNLFEEIDRFAKMHGPSIYRQVDFQSKLFDLRETSIETGFKIGVLFGVISSGAPKEVVDRYERGLAFAMQSDQRVVKKRP